MDRITVIAMVLFLFGAATIVQLFRIQVLLHDTYAKRSEDQINFESTVSAKRGGIFWSDRYSSDTLVPVAIDKVYWEVFVVPKNIEDHETVARVLSEELGVPLEEVQKKVNIIGDPYEPIKNKITEEAKLKLEAFNLKGVGFKEFAMRYYSENNLLSHITGFVGFKGDSLVGRYGLEEYFEEEFAGQAGSIETEIDARDRPIGVGNRTLKDAKDGINIVLTIDKTLQFVACGKLKKYVDDFNAQNGSVIIMDPHSGAILAMCNYPDFNPNIYNEVEDISIFINSGISHQYEPGSIFKPITVAAGINFGVIKPYSTYIDEGVVNIAGYSIRNSDQKTYGKSTMVDVLDLSINTGAIYVMQKTGKDAFVRYVKDFGFGELTGITLAGEAQGDIASLDKPGEIYATTASFGQGIAVTAIQVVTAFSAIANGGELLKPQIVKNIIYDNGIEKEMNKIVVRRVISRESADIISAMMTSVIQNGHSKLAGVDGYLIAGKTGTAQVPQKGGYSDETIHSFVGFGPTDDPVFVMLVKLDNPKGNNIRFSAQTTAPLFGEIAQFIFNYFEIPPNQEIK